MKPPTPAVGIGERLRSVAVAGVSALLLSSCIQAAPADDIDGAAPGSKPALPQPAPRNGAYHPEKGEAYRKVNSFRGIRDAGRKGYTWIDIDSQQCTDPATGKPVAVGTHWPRVTREFDDPTNPLPRDLMWRDLSCDRLSDLRGHPPHTHRVHLMKAMVRQVAKQEGLAIEWETKPHSPAFQRPAIFRPVLRLAKKLGVEIVVKTQTDSGARALRIMRAAKKAGARTMLLNTARPSIGLTLEEQSYLDYVRGDWHTV